MGKVAAKGGRGIRILLLIIGVLTALLTGVIALFTLGTVMLVIVTAGFLLLAIQASRHWAKGRKALPFTVGFLFIVSIATVIYALVTITRALTDVSGPVEPADAEALTSAETKLNEVENDAGFRVELTEDELTAKVQHNLAKVGAPLRRVSIDFVGGEQGGGHVSFEGTFRNGALSLRGRFAIALDAGAVRVELIDTNLGLVNLPGIAHGAVEELIDSLVAKALTDEGTEVQSIALTDEKVVVVGTQVGEKILSSQAVLSDLQQQALSVRNALTQPADKLGPGVVNGTQAEGSVYYVALGDSLAANVGVAQPREGYVSRFHNQVQRRDGAEYGLRNFGISGETSGSLIRTGQLDAALGFIRAHDVRYITLDVGANDLLGHLGSSDCSQGLFDPACQQRIADAFSAYEANLDRILKALREAAPEATVIFLQTYNPFSLGFGSQVSLEANSDRTLSEFNSLAARVAGLHGVLVGDGFTAMHGTAAATTHMLDAPPDIHPRSVGYDLLTAALLDALP